MDLFFVGFLKSGKIVPGFSLTLDSHCKPLLEYISPCPRHAVGGPRGNRFKGIGSISKNKVKNVFVYQIKNLTDIIDVLIPFMDNNPIFSERALHYDKFKTVSLMLKDENPLTYESKLKIVELCYNMNKEGKRRKLSKTEYINLLTNIYNKDKN